MFLSKLMKYIARVNPKVNCGHWVMMMCPCRFILTKKCITLVSDVGNEGSYACVGAGEISVPSSQFCCKLKTALIRVSMKIQSASVDQERFPKGISSMLCLLESYLSHFIHGPFLHGPCRILNLQLLT